jgi:hypothetical protein
MIWVIVLFSILLSGCALFQPKPKPHHHYKVHHAKHKPKSIEKQREEFVVTVYPDGTALVTRKWMERYKNLEDEYGPAEDGVIEKHGAIYKIDNKIKNHFLDMAKHQ